MPSHVRDAYLITAVKNLMANGGRTGGSAQKDPVLVDGTMRLRTEMIFQKMVKKKQKCHHICFHL